MLLQPPLRASRKKLAKALLANQCKDSVLRSGYSTYGSRRASHPAIPTVQSRAEHVVPYILAQKVTSRSLVEFAPETTQSLD